MNEQKFDTGYASIPIGSLEISVRRFATYLEKLGYTTHVDVFKSGKGGCFIMGDVSHVELGVELSDSESDDWVYETIRFNANGYAGFGKRTFGGEKWATMKARALSVIKQGFCHE